MSDSSIGILDGSTFLVLSPNGDIDARPDEPVGLLFQDTRHLSKWKRRWSLQGPTFNLDLWAELRS